MERKPIEVAELIASGLGAWRLSVMLTMEDGPGDIFKNIRYRTGAENDFGKIDWSEATALQRLLQCPYCMSIWAAAFLFVLRLVDTRLYLFALFVLSGSGITAMLEDILVRQP